MKKICIIVVLSLFSSLFAAGDDIARTGRDAYEKRKISTNSTRVQSRIPSTVVQSSTSPYYGTYDYSLSQSGAQNYTPTGMGVDGRTYSNNPVTSYNSYNRYAQSATGLQYSYPLYGTQLPNRISDRTILKTGMPEYDQYLQNKVLSETAYGENVKIDDKELKNSKFSGKEGEEKYSLSQEFKQQNQDLLTKQYIKDLISKEQGIETSEDPLGDILKPQTPDTAGQYTATEKDSDAQELDPSLKEEKDIFDLIRGEIGDYDIQNQLDNEKQQKQDDKDLEEENAQNKTSLDKIKDVVQGKEREKSEVEKRIEESVKVKMLEGDKLHEAASNIMGKHTTFASLSKDKFNTYMRKAEMLMDSGQYYKAINAYKTAKIYKKYDPLVHLGMCFAQFAAGEYLSSATSLNNAMLIYPDIVKMRVELTQMVGDRDVIENRMVDIERWIERNGSSELVFLLSYIYYEMDNPDWARDELVRAKDNFSERFRKNASILAEEVGADFNSQEMIEKELEE